MTQNNQERELFEKWCKICGRKDDDYNYVVFKLGRAISPGYIEEIKRLVAEYEANHDSK